LFCLQWRRSHQYRHSTAEHCGCRYTGTCFFISLVKQFSLDFPHPKNESVHKQMLAIVLQAQVVKVVLARSSAKNFSAYKWRQKNRVVSASLCGQQRCCFSSVTWLIWIICSSLVCVVQQGVQVVIGSTFFDEVEFCEGDHHQQQGAPDDQ